MKHNKDSISPNSDKIERDNSIDMDIEDPAENAESLDMQQQQREPAQQLERDEVIIRELQRALSTNNEAIENLREEKRQLIGERDAATLALANLKTEFDQQEERFKQLVQVMKFLVGGHNLNMGAILERFKAESGLLMDEMMQNVKQMEEMLNEDFEKKE